MGSRSIFALINETLSPHSKQIFLKLLLEGDSSEKSILDRQTRTKKWQKNNFTICKMDCANTRAYPRRSGKQT